MHQAMELGSGEPKLGQAQLTGQWSRQTVGRSFQYHGDNAEAQEWSLAYGARESEEGAPPTCRRLPGGGDVGPTPRSMSGGHQVKVIWKGDGNSIQCSAAPMVLSPFRELLPGCEKKQLSFEKHKQSSKNICVCF